MLAFLKRNKVELVLALLVGCTAFVFRERIEFEHAYLFRNSAECSREASREGFHFIRELDTQLERLRGASRIVRRDEEARELWSTPNGEIWAPAGSAEEIFYDLWEQNRGIYSYRGVEARAGDIVLDCGANIGLYSLRALKAGAALVVAIEPVPENVICLRRNLSRQIEQGKVIVVEKGVWDSEDFLEMNIDPHNAAAHSFVGKPRPGHVLMRLPLTTIDRLAEELGLERVDFIKMDIEGAERNALTGAAATIKKFQPRLAISVYHEPDDLTAIPAVVAATAVRYRMSCGPCIPTAKAFHPEVYFWDRE